MNCGSVLGSDEYAEADANWADVEIGFIVFSDCKIAMRVLDDNREMPPLDVVAVAIVEPLAPVVEVVACDVVTDSGLTGTEACNEVDPIMLGLVEICMT